MSLYWKCQLAGWTVIALWSVAVSSIVGNFRPQAVPIYILVSVLGLGLTHGYRGVIRRGRWIELSAGRLGWRILAGSASIGLAMGVLTLPFVIPLLREEASRIEAALGGSVSSAFLILGWSLIYFSYHHLRRSREATAREWQLRSAMRDAELRTLRAQLNPHFLFNSLNSLRGLIPECPARAQDAVTQLAGLLRHTLHLSRSPTVSLEDELAAARNYLALEEIRFEERLETHIDVDPALLDQAVPPMILQNLLENALRHGIAHLPRGGVVTLEARAAKGAGGAGSAGSADDPGEAGGAGDPGSAGDAGSTDVRLIVTNPGRLTDPGGQQGLGLANAREQLRILFGSRAKLELRQEGSGTVVCEILLPRRRQTEMAAGRSVDRDRAGPSREDAVERRAGAVDTAAVP